MGLMRTGATNGALERSASDTISDRTYAYSPTPGLCSGWARPWRLPAATCRVPMAVAGG